MCYRSRNDAICFFFFPQLLNLYSGVQKSSERIIELPRGIYASSLSSLAGIKTSRHLLILVRQWLVHLRPSNSRRKKTPLSLVISWWCRVIWISGKPGKESCWNHSSTRLEDIWAWWSMMTALSVSHWSLRSNGSMKLFQQQWNNSLLVTKVGPNRGCTRLEIRAYRFRINVR